MTDNNRSSGTGLYIIGIAATDVRRVAESSFHDLVRDAYLAALADAGIEAGTELTHAWFANTLMDYWGQSAGKGQAAMTPLIRAGLFPTHAWIGNVEAACASGSVAFAAALKDIRSGDADVALAIGVEKMNDTGDPGGYLAHMERGLDQLDPDAWRTLYAQRAQNVGATFAPSPGRSIAMDVYALWARTHMARYGTQAHQIAAAAAKNHTNAAGNPRAQYRFPLTVQDVLDDRLVADPLTRAMCAPTGDAAAAVIICSEKRLRAAPTKVRERAIHIRGQSLAGGTFDADWPDERAPVRAARAAYARTGIGPDDLDLIELHDASSFAELHLVEDLGLCAPGQGGPYTASGATARDGEIAVNPSGGLVSRGHPIGATGIIMLNELALQLRGEAGDVQIPNARLALAENGGGIIGNDIAVCSVTILERTES